MVGKKFTAAFINLLAKNETLKFWNRCRIHRNEPEFRDHVINGYKNSDCLRLRSYGDEYEGEIIYLADEQGGGMGFFAELGVTLIKLYFADERGLTPYVHWGKNHLFYAAGGIDGEENAFLHYFAPVSHVRKTDRAKHVLKSEAWHYEQVKSVFNAVSYDVTDEYVNAMARMMKKYIRYNDKTKRKLEEDKSRLLGDKKTLGIHYRGTDFRKQYNNHPVAVKIEQTIEEAKKLMARGDYEQIFLATDENDAVIKFKEVFGEKVKIYQDTYRGNGGDESIAFSECDRKDHKYRLGYEVLRDEYTLVQCEGLLCGYSNVTFMARIMRRGWMEQDYQDYVLINNGIYHNKNRFSESLHNSKAY